jgi:OmpA-OmpF porin, OOP family
MHTRRYGFFIVLLICCVSVAEGQFAFEKLPDVINAPASAEGMPVISADGKTIFFTRTRPSLDGTTVFDIWKGAIDENGVFGEPEVMEGTLGSRYGIAATSVSPDNNTLYLVGKFRHSTPPDERVYQTHRTTQGWSIPKPIRIRGLNLKGQITDYSFGPDQKTLVMALVRDSSLGGSDLYVSFLDEAKSEWTTPLWLGETVNSVENEVTPFLASDNKTLYFSSDRPGGFGELDVYRTVRKGDSWTDWSKPENLGQEINRLGRTSYFTVDAKGEYSYFVWRKDIKSQTDIYRKRLPKAHSRAIRITGKVTDDGSKAIDATIRYERLSDGKQLGMARTEPDNGSYQIVLPPNDTYGLRAERDGYIPVSEKITIDSLDERDSIQLDLMLVKIRENVPIRLNNLFFETNKAELLPESSSELYRLQELLLKQPQYRIAIDGHTDAVGTRAYNKTLSQNRANAVRDYLISHGITKERIESNGFADERPIDTNSTEEGKAKNRRVEFRILSN